MSDEQTDWQDEPVQVVRNDRGDWSIWPADRDPPAGWQAVGVSGEKGHCLEYIERQATEATETTETTESDADTDADR